MAVEGRPQVLCVDDEPNLLRGLARHLSRDFEVMTAERGAAGLAVIAERGPFAVVISDLQMPEMDGVTFLGRVRSEAPDTVRILLTGQANLDSAIDAVNEGHIFRFLRKPCPAALVVKSVRAAAEQYRLITAERVLLEQTLHGCIRTLTDLLGQVSPEAFGRATRVKQRVTDVLPHLEVANSWEVEIAAMLSQIGCVTLPRDTAMRLYQARELSGTERSMVERLPEIGAELLRNIPRLDGVARIVALQNTPMNVKTDIPLGARILKVLLDCDSLESRGQTATEALGKLRRRPSEYDSTVLDAVGDLLGAKKDNITVRRLPHYALRVGMIVGEDVIGDAGLLLLARGQEITQGLVRRIENFPEMRRAFEELLVLVPTDESPEANDARSLPAGGESWTFGDS